MRVLIDCDNCLNNLTEVILSIYNRDWNDDLIENDITTYSMEQFVKPAARKTFYHYFLNKEVWKQVKPNLEAKKVINLFRENNIDIYVCTSTEPENAYKKAQWCWREFGIDPRKEFILTHNKRIIKADFLIDDCLDNFGEQNVYCLLDKPWNRIDNSNVERFNNWRDIGNFILKCKEGEIK